MNRGAFGAGLAPGLARMWGGIVTVRSTLRPTPGRKAPPVGSASDESVLQESAPFPGRGLLARKPRLRLRRLRLAAPPPPQPTLSGSQPSLQEATPFYGADSWSSG